jgi:hypothetical protein
MSNDPAQENVQPQSSRPHLGWFAAAAVIAAFCCVLAWMTVQLMHENVVPLPIGDGVYVPVNPWMMLDGTVGIAILACIGLLYRQIQRFFKPREGP